MKYLRQFVFKPTWKSRGTSDETDEDKYPLPSFNDICEFLEDRGWEVHSWEYIEDEGVLGYHKRDDMRSLIVYATSTAYPRPLDREGYYIYEMTAKGLK